MRTIEFIHRRKRIIVSLEGTGRSYGFIYPEKTTYVDREGPLRCIMCTEEAHRFWNKRGTGGWLYCNKCERDLGQFTALGYGVEWPED